MTFRPNFKVYTYKPEIRSDLIEILDRGFNSTSFSQTTTLLSS